jgi:hypothetical protein
MAVLDSLIPRLRPYKHVLTVCQHIRALQYVELFKRAGVTDLYWSHATRLSISAPCHVHPFPLFPVQRPLATPKPLDERPLLFSFVGARANKWYLTQTRNHVIDLMSKDSRGIVIARNQWHFNEVVYDHQIRGTSSSEHGLVNQDYTSEYQRLLADSVFSICPSGTGPNSIRLWESIEFGTIPVILSETYRPPGPTSLWEEAAVWCDETPNKIRTLADRLGSIRKDSSLLGRKLQACAQIRALYGPDNCVYDLQCRTVALHAAARDSERSGQELSRSQWLLLAAAMSREPAPLDRNIADLFLQSTTTRILTEHESIRHLLLSHRGLAEIIRRALSQADESRAVLFCRAAKLRQLDYLLDSLQ